MTTSSQEYEQVSREQFRKTGAPHGLMQPQELVPAATTAWERVKQNVPIEDRQQFEPILEALLGRVAYSSPESARSMSTIVSSSTK